MAEVYKNIVVNFIQAFEEVTVPSQNSYDDLSSLSESNSYMKKSKSEVGLSLEGVFKAWERLNIPKSESNDSLCSMSSQHSFSSMESLDESGLTASNLFKAMETFAVGSYGSTNSLASLGESSPRTLTIEDQKNQLTLMKYLSFFVKTFDEFMLNQPQYTTETSDDERIEFPKFC